MSKAKTKVLLVAAALLLGAGTAQAQVKLLNVSYDPTRELYQDVNKAFAAQWKQKTGQSVDISQSHGGSGKQARSVIDGLEADVVTLALAYRHRRHRREVGAHQERTGRSGCPTTRRPTPRPSCSSCARATRSGIKDWGDLVKPGTSVVTPNPKTSGGARWNYLAAWAWAKKQFGGDQAKVRGVRPHALQERAGARLGRARLDDHLRAARDRPRADRLGERGVLPGRGAGQGQVRDHHAQLSILAEPPVAVVDKNVDKHGTRAVAEAYLKFLYTPRGRSIAAKHYYRPRNAAVAKRTRTASRRSTLVTIDGAFGGWQKAQKTHFADGGLFDQIYQPGS